MTYEFTNILLFVNSCELAISVANDVNWYIGVALGRLIASTFYEIF